MPADLAHAIEQLDLTPAQKQALRLRWLAQVQHFDQAAGRNARWASLYRLVTVAGGAVLPGLIGLLIGGRTRPVVGQSALLLSALIGVSTTLEQFLQTGERWRAYRYTEEVLTSEGWQFLQLAGLYRTYTSHSEAFPDFASRVEEIVQRASDMYLTGVSRDHRAEFSNRTQRSLRGQPDS